MAAMSTFLRLLVSLSIVALVVLTLYQPRALGDLWRRVRLVAYLWIAVIVTSAVLRATGVVTWGT